jgi:hypothetical protein
MDQRRGPRWTPEGKNVAFFSCDGFGDKICLGDVSSSGMRGFFPRPVQVGTQLNGRIEFCYDIIEKLIPFNISGEVVRVNEINGQWDTAIKITKLMRGVVAA